MLLLHFNNNESFVRTEALTLNVETFRISISAQGEGSYYRILITYDHEPLNESIAN